MKNFPIFGIDLINGRIKHTNNLKTNKFLNFSANLHVISEVIHWYRAKKRSAFAKALSKGNVKGSGKKPFPQKGKGMARQGTLKNPHQRGGGVAFPPTGRSFKYKINKKKVQIALRSIFFIRLLEGRIIILEDLILQKPSTSTIGHSLGLFNFKKILLIDENNINLRLSIKNMEQIKFLPYKRLNTFDFMLYPHIILTKTVFKIILF